jgi:hypothetical protein
MVQRRKNEEVDHADPDGGDVWCWIVGSGVGPGGQGEKEKERKNRKLPSA